MAVSTPALHDALGDLVGAPHLLRDPAALPAYAVDGVVPWGSSANAMLPV